MQVKVALKEIERSEGRMKSLQENLAQLRWMSEFQPNTNGTRAPQGK